MSDTMPLLPPPMPAAVRGVATVQGTEAAYTVNFDTGECDCQHGAAWRFDGKRYKPQSFCAHKLKALASLVEASYGGDDENYEELYDFFELQCGKRYNAFEAVSSFHKELRRGDVDQALYWATIVVAHRGRHGVINYMRNIIFEETRDLALANYVFAMSSYGKSVSQLHMQRAVIRFCRAPKKWELNHRLPIFLDEQRGYKALIVKYGKDVAKPAGIIAKSEHKHLLQVLFEGFSIGKRDKVQYGLKGFFKAQAPSLEQHHTDLFNYLVEVMNGEHENAFEFDPKYAYRVYEYVIKKVNTYGVPGYHDINALCDALTGEPGDGAATLPAPAHKAITSRPTPYRIPLAPLRRVPLYASDNHTWKGKALMRTHGPTQLLPGADQTDIDFRLCGAYQGVAWRYLAFKQHATIDCKWGDVKWNTPTWLWAHTNEMWYVFALFAFGGSFLQSIAGMVA